MTKGVHVKAKIFEYFCDIECDEFSVAYDYLNCDDFCKNADSLKDNDGRKILGTCCHCKTKTKWIDKNYNNVEYVDGSYLQLGNKIYNPYQIRIFRN